MSNEQKADRERVTGRPFVMPVVPEALWIQMDALLQEQGDLLNATQTMITAWTKRRHEGMEAAFRTFCKVCDCNNLDEMAAVYGEWLTGSMDRIVTDMTETRDEALRLSKIGQKAMAALLPNGADTIESPDRAETLVGGDRSSHQTTDAPAGLPANKVRQRAAATRR